MGNEPQNQDHIRFAVVGPGALGTLFSARLALAGIPTFILDYRAERAGELNARPIRLLDAAGEHEIQVPVTADPRSLAGVDAALVLVKAYQTENAAMVLAEHLTDPAIAISLQNGLGNVEILAAHLGQDRVIGGVTAQGALLETPGVVRDTGSGPTTLGRPDGSMNGSLPAVAAALLAAGFAVAITSDLPAALWGKAILNAAINPVAALTRLRNGALAEHEPSLRLMTAAAREAAQIARKHGINIPVGDWRARLQTVCQATAPNVNSMLADVLHARQTEIHAINGAIVGIAEQHGMPSPVNQTLLCLVNTLECTYAMQVAG